MNAPRPARLFVTFALALAFLAATASAAGAFSFLGFNDDWNLKTVRHTVLITSQFHASSDRMVIYWGSVEPRKHRFNWYVTDVQYRAMLARHIRPLLTPVSAPAWTTARNCRNIFKCQQTAAYDGDYRDFMKKLAARYPRVAGIEVGNEPNLTNWAAHPDPARYAQILKVAYAAVKSANRHTRVIVGGTCCTTAHGGGNIGASLFLALLYRHGIKGHYDAIGFHLYPGRAISLVTPDLLSELAGMRAVRNANGDRSPFWITETGFPSRGVSRYGGGVFSEQNQAQREVIAYRTLSQVPDVQALYFYRLTDPLRPGPFDVGMGILHTNFRPKLSAFALKQAIGRARR